MKARTRPDDFREAMRLTALGVAVLTTDGEAGRAGVTVSTFQSFSMEPPSVLACIHCESRNLEAILKNGIFAANVLAAAPSRRGLRPKTPPAWSKAITFQTCLIRLRRALVVRNR